MKALPVRYAAFALLGVVAGVFSGLFGVGGGIIMVPFLIVLAGYTAHMAQGISLGVIIPTAIVGALGYFRKGNLDPAVVVTLSLGSIPGAYLGQDVAQRLPQSTLRTLFALFMVAVAARVMPSGSPRAMSLLIGMALVAVGVRLVVR